VGGERLEVRLSDPGAAPAAEQALQPLCVEDPVTDGNVVKLTVRPRAGLVVDAVRLLDGANVGVEDLGLRRPTLDDVFLALTGHAAEEEGAGEDGREAA
jgi:ABC-2 type transport system ATP-binding protein